MSASARVRAPRTSRAGGLAPSSTSSARGRGGRSSIPHPLPLEGLSLEDGTGLEHLDADRVLQLQRTAGNAAVGSLLVQRDPESGSIVAARPPSPDYRAGYRDGRASNPKAPGPRTAAAIAEYQRGYAAGLAEANRQRNSAYEEPTFDFGAPDPADGGDVLFGGAGAAGGGAGIAQATPQASGTAQPAGTTAGPAAQAGQAGQAGQPAPAGTLTVSGTTDIAAPPARPSIAVPKRTAVTVPDAKPPDKEAAPDLGVDTSLEFWGIKEAADYATVLGEGWATRTASSKKPADATSVRSDLAKDFDETMQGWFARSSFGVPWNGLPDRIVTQLEAQRKKLRATLSRKLKGDALEAAIEAEMVVARQNVVDRVHSHLIEGAWGWMTERREHLDFATIEQKGVKALKGFGPAALTTTDDERAAIHAALVAAGKDLTDDERTKAVDRATATKQKQTKQAGATLTDDERDAAVASAEKAKLGAAAADKVIAKLRSDALGGEQASWVDVHERDAGGNLVWGSVWGKDSIGAMRKTAELIRNLIAVAGSTFGASNYHGHGGGSFLDRGRSVDLTIPQSEASGFFEPNAAVQFLLNLDQAASTTGVEWRVLYDDFKVARAVNEQLGKQRVVEVANTSTNKSGAITNVNWHGPLVTHFHLDIGY